MNSDLVLEIGAGHHPSPSADVVVDKYFDDDTERGGPLKIVCPTVIADGEHLPFRDGAFARTIGRQVMERMEDIAQFFEELMRVSSAGYLAAPSYLREHAFGWPYHKWLIAHQEGMLVCARKRTPYSPRHGVLLHYWAARNKHFRRFIRSLPVEFLHVQYYWTGQIQYRIVDDLKLPDFGTFEQIEAYLDAHATGSSGAQSFKQWALRRLPESVVKPIDRVRQTYYSAKRTRTRQAIDLDRLLVCPACKQDVLKEKQRYVCDRCNRIYPIRDGVPVFLLEEHSGGASDVT